MRKRLAVALVVGVAAAGLLAAPSQARGTLAPTLKPPSWYTSALHKKVVAAGAQGLSVGDERLNTDCPGVHTGGVAAGGCIVAPAGCTANFIFTDGSSYYIGTARHCVNRIGDELVMQVDPTTLASVGTVVAMTSGPGDAGNDFSLARIDPAVAAKWGVTPALPIIGGPNGVYSGCGPVAVKYYGHGYGVAVAQGKPEAGLATRWYDDGFGWNGLALPGDSGSAVLTADGQAAGDLTELLVDTGPYLGTTTAGTRATRILQFLGGNYRLVNANGSTSGPVATHCGLPG